MTYEESVNYIHSRLRFGMKPGLERIFKLLEKLGKPQDELEFVHIAGTNGKGSTAAMLSSVFSVSGKKTGLFTSPYITDFRERISVNGEMIPKSSLAEIVSYIAPIVNEMEQNGEIITEFELITALAFCYFKNENCGIVVLETGLGGRFDSTNVIKAPLASVITKISLDHTDILGDTISQITFEKCGILKQGGICVSYPEQESDALEVIFRESALKNNKVFIGNAKSVQILEESIHGTDFIYDGLEIKLPLAGIHQIKNAVTAITAAKVLNIKNKHIVKGISLTAFPARLELFSDNPIVILDGAHNPDGIKSLADFIGSNLSGYKIIAIMGMLEDKAADESLSLLAPYFSVIFAVTPDNPRGLSSDAFADFAGKYCPDVRPENNIKSALEKAFSLLDESTALICCGSLYLAGEIRPFLTQKFK